MTQKAHSLSAIDLALFVLETPERMSNIGPLAILKPPPRTRNPGAYADRLLRDMKKRPVGAPFNRVYHPPGLKDLPKLVTIDDIDLDVHCHRHTLPAGSSDEDLMVFVCRLHEPMLDRSRPPWEFHIIDGLQGGRIALYGKVHHGIIDGRGFVEVCTRWFQADAANKDVRAMWEGLPQPRSAAAAHKAAKTRLHSATQQAVQATRTLASLYAGLARQALATTGLAPGMPLPFFGTSSDLGGKPSVQRILAHCKLPLKAVKAFGKGHHASVNDVLLTVLDMALNRYLRAKGRSGKALPLVADMPVALSSGTGGNAIAVLQFHLGAAGASPLERLAQIKQRTGEVKEHVRRTDASALITYTAAVHAIPAMLETLRVPKAPTLANAIISNPFGMPYRAYLAGAELEMILPVSMLVPGQSLNITAVTYAEHLQIAFLGLEAQMPDIGELATFATEAFAELRQAA
ncbi:MAG: DUF1298 domain-containing protein [Ideonella sp.]|nr:DUF1298 domain-containing protein [Ideonella sp.]